MTYLTGGTRRRTREVMARWAFLLGLLGLCAGIWVAVIAAALWAWGLLP